MWRPELRIEVPGAVTAGESLPISVHVRTTTACEARHLEVALLQLVVRRPPGGNAAVLVERHIVATERAPLAGLLSAGSFARRVTFAVPESAPPTYEGFSVDIEYRVTARLDLVRRLDGLAELPVRVTQPRGAPLPVIPALRVSAAKGTAFIEVALAASSSAPGASFRGSCALSRAVTGGHLELSLVGYEGSIEAHRHTVYLAVPALGQGEPFRFSLPVPRILQPGFEAPVCTLSWDLHASFDGDGLQLAAPPIPVTLAVTPPLTTTQHLPVGTARWDAIFQQAAAETGLLAEGRTLVGEVGRATLCLAEDEAEGHGQEGAEAGIAATLVWDSLDLGLIVERNQGRALVKGPSFVTRFPAHRTAFEEDAALVSVLQRFHRLALDDRGGRAVLADRAKVPGRLREAQLHVNALVLLLHDRALALPYPPHTDGRADLLRELAQSVSGRFSPGSLSIRGADLDGDPFTVLPRWEKTTLSGLRVEVPLVGPLLSEQSLAKAVARIPAPAALSEMSPVRALDGCLVTDVPFVQPTRAVLGYVRYLITLAKDLGGTTSRGPYR